MRETKPPQNANNGKSATECQAHGCPMPGTYRINNDASLCCVHDGEDPSAWPAQTERIKTHLRLAWLMLAMSNAMAGELLAFDGTLRGMVMDLGREDIGVVLLETAANPAVYPFTGDELYVRAKVVSSKPQENPVREGDPQIAWVQPVRVAR